VGLNNKKETRNPAIDREAYLIFGGRLHCREFTFVQRLTLKLLRQRFRLSQHHVEKRDVKSSSQTIAAEEGELLLPLYEGCE
jgi:hypothetical protein